MDEPGPLAALRSWRRVWLYPGCFLTIALLYSCLSSPDQRALPAPREDYAVLTKRIETLRRLALKRDISFVSPSPTTEPGGLAPSNYGPLPLEPIERTYKSIGLLPHDTDLRKALTEYRRIEGLVNYDTAKGIVTPSTGASKLGVPFALSSPGAGYDLPVILGVMEALQSQHFKWSNIVQSNFIEDTRLAYRAIAGGDALFTALTVASGKEKSTLAPPDIETASRLASEIERMGSRLPDFLRRQLGFPYREGIRFISWALAAKGWDGVNALYLAPPVSTAQILHPERYFVRRVDPLRFFPAGLIRRLVNGPVVEQSVGEYLLRERLATEHHSKYAADTAAAWRGDQLFSFEDRGSALTAWFSSWENERDAIEFRRAYQTVLEKRLRIRFRSSAGTKDDRLIADARDRGALLLEVKGPVVLLLNVVPASQALELADEAWKDLEIEPASSLIPFESANLRFKYR